MILVRTCVLLLAFTFPACTPLLDRVQSTEIPDRSEVVRAGFSAPKRVVVAHVDGDAIEVRVVDRRLCKSATIDWYQVETRTFRKQHPQVWIHWVAGLVLSSVGIVGLAVAPEQPLIDDPMSRGRLSREGMYAIGGSSLGLGVLEFALGIGSFVRAEEDVKVSEPKKRIRSYAEKECGDDEPVPNVVVSITAAGSTMKRSAQTGKDGKARFELTRDEIKSAADPSIAEIKVSVAGGPSEIFDAEKVDAIKKARAELARQREEAEQKEKARVEAERKKAEEKRKAAERAALIKGTIAKLRVKLARKAKTMRLNEEMNLLDLPTADGQTVRKLQEGNEVAVVATASDHFAVVSHDTKPPFSVDQIIGWLPQSSVIAAKGYERLKRAQELGERGVAVSVTSGYAFRSEGVCSSKLSYERCVCRRAWGDWPCRDRRSSRYLGHFTWQILPGGRIGAKLVVSDRPEVVYSGKISGGEATLESAVKCKTFRNPYAGGNIKLCDTNHFKARFARGRFVRGVGEFFVWNGDQQDWPTTDSSVLSEVVAK